LHSLENAVKEKEELDEGLHLIDFEQLKIENQTLNEKIEERNDELHKLRKKTTTTVQVLTHIKEKLKFVEEENKHFEQELLVLNESVNAYRDSLTRAKHARDSLRNENAQLKQKQGFIGSDLLVSDFEGRKSEMEKMREKVNALRRKYEGLENLVKNAQKAQRILKRTASAHQGGATMMQHAMGASAGHSRPYSSLPARL
jgi:chromosome segregation ATPase